MKLLAVHSFPVWADTTPQEAWDIIDRFGGREEHPEVTEWQCAFVLEIEGQRRSFLAVDVEGA